MAIDVDDVHKLEHTTHTHLIIRLSLIYFIRRFTFRSISSDFVVVCTLVHTTFQLHLTFFYLNIFANSLDLAPLVLALILKAFVQVASLCYRSSSSQYSAMVFEFQFENFSFEQITSWEALEVSAEVMMHSIIAGNLLHLIILSYNTDLCLIILL